MTPDLFSTLQGYFPTSEIESQKQLRVLPSGNDSSSYRQLSDQQLHQKMISTSQNERELTAQMITLIQEASRRKFYLDLGYGTLFAYLTDGLKYSAASAMRRIESSRIASDIPEVKEKVLDGSLTLSNLARAQQFFKQEAKSNHKLNVEEKKEVLKMLEGQSTRDAERTLASLSTQPVQMAAVEQVKPLTKELSKISFLADQEFMNQLEEAKGLLASTMPGASVSEIMAEIMKLGLAELNRKKFKLKKNQDLVRPGSQQSQSSQPQPKALNRNIIHRPDKKQPLLESVSDAGTQEKSEAKVSAPELSANSTHKPVQSRYISAEVQRLVRMRDGNKCTYIHPKTYKRCGSTYNTQFDHYPIPYAAGGGNSVENLRLVCSSCNRLHGVQYFGRKKMIQYASRK